MSGNSHSFAIYLLSYDHLCRDKWSRFVFFSMRFLWLFYSSSVTTLSRCVLPERKTDPSSPSSIWGLSLCLLTGLCFFAFIFLVGPLLPLHGVYLVRLWVNFVLYFIPLILSNCWLFVRNFFMTSYISCSLLYLRYGWFMHYIDFSVCALLFSSSIYSRVGMPRTIVQISDSL